MDLLKLLWVHQGISLGTTTLEDHEIYSVAHD